MSMPDDVATDAPDDPALHARLLEAIATLEQVAAHRGVIAELTPTERQRLIVAAGRVYNPDSAERRQLVRASVRRRKAANVRRDERVLATTGIRSLRRATVVRTPDPLPRARPEPEPARPEVGRNCYVCKRDYTELHHFYDQLCPECAAFNFAKRGELADLRGRVALLTGGRVKIGYQAGIKLLRCGARLIVTTRFPCDAASRYAQEPDFEQWRDRLEIHGLDLRHTPSVESLCHHLLTTRPRLDYIVNNACQTVRRPPHFYAHMLERERAALRESPTSVRALLAAVGAAAGRDGDAAVMRTPPTSGIADAAELSQLRLLPGEQEAWRHLFPAGRLDPDRQQVDLREHNSWRMTLAEVPSVELLEVQLINAIAPFILNARLKPLLMRTGDRDKHIVNVSAVEGQFYRRGKTTRHPHTNMAKAALNMLTRTSAADYQQDGIHMNSVDTGWVTDEDPAHLAERKQLEHRFHPPLDIVDGAARIVDPIIAGTNGGEHVWGQFLKDYRPVDW